MEKLYDDVMDMPTSLLGQSQHDMIKRARHAITQNHFNEEMREEIYEQRLYAESMISRPVMKNFKSLLRAAHILPPKDKEQ